MSDEKPLQQGKSWNLRDLKGKPEEVCEEVAASAFVPDACKAMIIEAIEQTHSNGKLIRLDAHCQVVNTPKGPKHLFTMDISRL